MLYSIKITLVFFGTLTSINDRYTCECEGWDEMMIDSIINEIQSKIDENAGYWDDTEWKEQISYMKGLL